MLQNVLGFTFFLFSHGQPEKTDSFGFINKHLPLHCIYLRVGQEGYLSSLEVEWNGRENTNLKTQDTHFSAATKSTNLGHSRLCALILHLQRERNHSYFAHGTVVIVKGGNLPVSALDVVFTAIRMQGFIFTYLSQYLI